MSNRMEGWVPLRLRRSRGAGILLALLLILLSACTPQSLPSSPVTASEAPSVSPIPEAPPSSPADPEIRLAFLGDILLGGGLAGVIADRGADYPWRHAAFMLQAADLALGNLETSVTTSGSPAKKTYTFRSHPDTLRGAARAGIDVLTLANNHSLDFGPEALLESIGHVKAAGIYPVGAGQDAAEAFSPVIVAVKGLKVAVFGFTRVIPVPEWAAGEGHAGLAAGYDPKPVIAALDAVRTKVDIIIVLFHWGEERQETPRPMDISLARAMIGHGATIVVGHHPHVLQGIDLHDGNLIAYSLGNFIFTTVDRRLNQETGILAVRAKRSGVTGAHFTPLYIAEGQPRPVTGREGERILARLDQLSRRWHTRVTRDGSIGNQ
jgi:poly-gamma-glutamate capsule biosynthesis protein CapA/YwtB (metallophosphatase superfamily)